MQLKSITVIFGTRPEAIKLAPVILALKRNQSVKCTVCVTAQHREMLDQVLDVFEIHPDVDFNLMQPNQTLGSLTARAIDSLDRYFSLEKPDAVLVQGDTTTVLAASLAAFYNKIPIGHIEAGLRTGNLYSPFPEEANRVLTTRLARWHFAPTELNKQNLLKEGVEESRICITGNTVIDALFIAIEKITLKPPVIMGMPNGSLDCLGTRRMVLITGHRRENFGQGFENICTSIDELAHRFPDIAFIYPVHLNPNVREPVERILRKQQLSNVYLIEPQSYLPFVALMNRAYFILTDSGGVQEEAPSLGKPVLVMRDTTERPEAVMAGTVKLIGTECSSIVNESIRLIMENNRYNEMTKVINPYGDGNATERILNNFIEKL